MAAHKFDHPPLLAPGRHFMTLREIESLCVHRFHGQARQRREKLSYALEELAQELLRVKLSCIAFVDGSFLSEKPDPGDVDVLVNIDDDVMQNLLPEQRILIDALNLEHYIAFVDDRKTGAGKDSLDQIASWDERRRKCRREEQCSQRQSDP
jgi:hypothetical protein